MRHPSPRMFFNDATHLPLVWTDQDAAGGRRKTWPLSGGIQLRCSVQPGGDSRRQPMQGAIRSEVDAIAYFHDDPSVSVDDRLVWHVTGQLDRTFSAKGPANPPAGRDGVWSLDLMEIKS